MIGIDYDSFMIISCIGAHYLRNNTTEGLNWDSVWELTRSKQDEQIYNKKKLTIFAVSNIMNLPKETVRRKIEALKKKKFITYSTKQGLLPTDKIETVMKPFAEKELVEAHVPNAKANEPVPTAAVSLLKPPKTRVSAAAKELILIWFENALALALSVISRLTDVPLFFALSAVAPSNGVIFVSRSLNFCFTWPRPEICRFFWSLPLVIAASCGARSAATIESMISVVFRPEPTFSADR